MSEGMCAKFRPVKGELEQMDLVIGNSLSWVTDTEAFMYYFLHIFVDNFFKIIIKEFPSEINILKKFFKVNTQNNCFYKFYPVSKPRVPALRGYITFYSYSSDY